MPRYKNEQQLLELMRDYLFLKTDSLPWTILNV